MFGHTNRAVSKRKKKIEEKKNDVIVSEINQSFSRQGDRLLSFSAAKSVVTRGESNRAPALFNLGPVRQRGGNFILQFNRIESICVTERAAFIKRSSHMVCKSAGG